MRLLICIVALCWPAAESAQQPITVEGHQFNNVEALHDFLIAVRSDGTTINRYQERQLKTSALIEYAKRDPDGARDIALSEMAKSDPNVGAEALLCLDDAEIPELTDAFRENLKVETYYDYLACVERYGSGELLPDVVALYERHKGRWACDIAAHCLGFVVKHDRANGLQMVEEAMSIRASTGCYHDVMRSVLVAYPGPDVLELSLRHIGDFDAGVSTNAAYVASKQEGGKERLRNILSSQPRTLSSRTRTYIETQLLAALN